MKLALHIFLHTALCLSVLAQQKTDKDLDGLRGPVRTVRTTSFQEAQKAGKPVKKVVIVDIVETYDRQGNLIEKNGRGRLSTGKSLFSWDTLGRRVEKIVDVPPNPAAPPPPMVPGGGPQGGDTFLTFVTTYQYDTEKRRLDATTHRGNGQLLWIDTYLFDEKGLLVEHARKNRVEDVAGSQFRFVYKLDARGAVTESTHYAADGKVTSRELYQATVDKQGNWISRTVIYLDATGKSDGESRKSVRSISYY